MRLREEKKIACMLSTAWTHVHAEHDYIYAIQYYVSIRVEIVLRCIFVIRMY